MNKRNLRRKLERIFTKRGLDVREHSIKNILNYLEPCLPHVMAIGTSGGKTMTTAAKLVFLHELGLLTEDKKVLILAADKTILRENFIEAFDEFFKKVKAPFSYRAVKTKAELKKALEDNIQVIITLPQSLNSPAKLKLASKFNWEWFIQDEAHKWYFDKTIKNIIEELQPKYQSLLTGTPFEFTKINRESLDPKYAIEYTSVAEMYDKGYLANVEAQVLHSDVALTKLDYASMLGNLKKDVRVSKEDTISSFNSAIDQMIKKLKVPVKRFTSTHNITNNMTSVFGKLKKTIIYCHGIPEANYLIEYLTQNNIGAVVTHSKIKNIKSDSVFKLFKEDDDIKVLVAVQQGREGFDFPDLENVIDMTYSKNFSVVMQIIGRLLRKNKDIPKKFFFKVAPKHTHSYFVDWMNALFMLFGLEWYSTFDGKNGFDIKFPKFDENEGEEKEKPRTPPGPGGPRQPGTFKPTNLSNFNSLEFMSKNKWFKLNDVMSTVAYTTLGDIARKHRSDEALTLKAEKYIDDFYKSQFGLFFNYCKKN